VCLDVCNPAPATNIDGIALTQYELARVSPAWGHHVDEGLQEVARRLLGRQEVLDTSPAAQDARAATARYLWIRIQSHDKQKPGRTPDMSPEAAAAMKAVLIEVGSSAWEPLEALVAKGAAKQAKGAANLHSQIARTEGAKKLVGNHFNVVSDICNPSPTQNIIGIPLTQTELSRVPPAYAIHVDQCLREVVYRLLDVGKPEVLDDSPQAQEARVICSVYLQTRIQGQASEKPGRKPDMTFAAAAAVKGVVSEVASGGGGGAGTMAAKLRQPDDDAVSLAHDLEKMAEQLKMGGRLTSNQIKQVSQQMQAHSSEVKSSVCEIM